MIERADAGVDLGLARAIEREIELDARLGGLAL
jgi:hypothetical protein